MTKHNREYLSKSIATQQTNIQKGLDSIALQVAGIDKAKVSLRAKVAVEPKVEE